MGQASLDNVTILDLLYAITTRHDEVFALQLGTHKVTYNQLRERSVDISATLIRFGIKEDERLAILSESRPEWAIAFFGIVSAAGITVPMDTKLSETEIVFILNDSQARAIFISSRYLGTIQRRRKDLAHLEFVFCFDQVSENDVIWTGDLRYGESDQRNRPEEVQPEDTALIVYTSGTTGVAKGVELSYQNLLFEVMALHDLVKLRPKDRYISILPLNHMLEITGGLIAPLYGGACVTYCNSLKAPTILKLMQEKQATVMVCVPLILKMFHNGIMREVKKFSLFEQKIFRAFLRISFFLNKGRIPLGKVLFKKIHKNFGGRLRCFVCGGAPLEKAIEADFAAMGFTILQGYGLTETSPVISVNTFNAHKPGSVGKPLSGMEVKICKGNETGPDEGEIVVRGPNIMKGYYKRPDLTQEVIREGWFHTGDIGYFDKEGFLFISGRMKNLIVLGAGKKVFPEEVEEVMSKSPYIKEICVLGKIATKGIRKGCEEIYAVVVPNFDHLDESEKDDMEKVRKKISEEFNRLSLNLAGYKRIMNFEVCKEELPKTSTRKIKRKLVIEKIGEGTQRHVKANDFIEAKDFLEDDLIKTLRHIVADVVSCDEHTIQMSSHLYADLAIDSLLKVEILVALQKEQRIRIPERFVYEISTFTDLVKFAKEYQEREDIEEFNPQKEVDEILNRNLRLEFFHNISYFICKAFFRTYCRCSVVGIEHIPSDKSFIVAANHTSLLDFPLILTSLPFVKTKHILAPAAQDYFYSKSVRKTIVELLFNTFPFERMGDFLKGMKVCEGLLKRGKSIILFPEGTRNIESTLKSFKPGIGSLSSGLNVPIVPVYVKGAFDALPKGARVPLPKKIRLYFGKPIYPQDVESKEQRYIFYKKIADRVKGEILKLKQDAEL